MSRVNDRGRASGCRWLTENQAADGPLAHLNAQGRARNGCVAMRPTWTEACNAASSMIADRGRAPRRRSSDRNSLPLPARDAGTGPPLT